MHFEATLKQENPVKRMPSWLFGQGGDVERPDRGVDHEEPFGVAANLPCVRKLLFRGRCLGAGFLPAV
jgi:hypothetical protein